MAENFSQAMEKTAGADGTIKQIKVEDKIYDIKDQPLRDWVDRLNLAEQGAAGSYIQKVSETDGKLAATTKAFDTTINATTAANDNNVPSTKAVKSYVDSVINGLDVAATSGTGYISAISETNGKVAATYTAWPTFNQNTTGKANTAGTADYATRLGDASANYTKSTLDTALNSKANLASPALTGTPTAPTAAAGTNSTQIATTAFVKTAISNLINGAPAAYDTLKEISDALGSNSVAGSILARIGNLETKVGISGSNASFNGTVTTNSLTLNGYKLSIS